MKPEFSLLTTVIEAEHLDVLSDWLDFIGVAPKRLIVIVSDEKSVRRIVHEWGIKREISVEICGECSKSLIAQRETQLLNDQFDIAGSDLVVLLRLDSFPARQGHASWFSDSLSLMRATGAQFLTGATKPYRADKPTTHPDYLITNRVSNNFLVVDAPVWRRFQSLGKELDHEFDRFFTEGAIEKICQRDGLFGIRRINTTTWRVFHTQAWGSNAESVRKSVRLGGSVIEPFLQGFEDDLFGLPPWERYFMYPRPSQVKLWRIAFGKWRRGILGF